MKLLLPLQEVVSRGIFKSRACKLVDENTCFSLIGNMTLPGQATHMQKTASRTKAVNTDQIN